MCDVLIHGHSPLAIKNQSMFNVHHSYISYLF